jgi:hypothetical protein
MIGMATISAWSAGSRPERVAVTHAATEIRSQDVDEAMNKEQDHERDKPSEISLSASGWVDPAFEQVSLTQILHGIAFYRSAVAGVKFSFIHSS